MIIDKRRRNEIFEALVAAGQDPRSYEVRHDVVLHRATRSSFEVKRYGLSLDVKRVVGDGDLYLSRLPNNWDTVMDVFPEWVTDVVDFAEAPDLFAELLSGQDALVTPTPNGDNALFTDAEKAQISAQLQEVRRYADASFGLSEQQMRQLEGHLRYLEDAAERHGRMDWRGLAIGTVVTMAMNALIPASEVRQVITILLQPVAHIFGHPPLLPPGT